MSEELTKTKLLPIQGKDMDSIMPVSYTHLAPASADVRYGPPG